MKKNKYIYIYIQYSHAKEEKGGRKAHDDRLRWEGKRFCNKRDEVCRGGLQEGRGNKVA